MDVVKLKRTGGEPISGCGRKTGSGKRLPAKAESAGSTAAVVATLTLAISESGAVNSEG